MLGELDGEQAVELELGKVNFLLGCVFHLVNEVYGPKFSTLSM